MKAAQVTAKMVAAYEDAMDAISDESMGLRIKKGIAAAISEMQASASESDAVVDADSYPCRVEEIDFEADRVVLRMIRPGYRLGSGNYVLRAATVASEGKPCT